jgi:diacylglycerol O-acyltransferase
MSATHPMSHPDAAWLHMDRPTNLMIVTGVLWFEETPDWDRVREVVKDRLVSRYPRFRQRVVEGRPPLAGPHWEDDPGFDPDLHFHRVALPPPGDVEALRALVADIAATPLDRSQALWQFHLVDGFGDGAAIVARIHHCIADGIALARVLLSLTDESDERPPAEPDADEAGHGRLGALTAPARGALSAAIGATGSLVHESVEIAIPRISSTSPQRPARTSRDSRSC